MENIYGYVDAVLQFYQLYAAYLIKMGFIRSKTDPCLFILKNEQGELIMLASCHVNDTQIAGTEEQLKTFKQGLREWFKIKNLGEMRKHLGVNYSWEEDKQGPKVVVTMHDLIKEIIDITKEHLGTSI